MLSASLVLIDLTPRRSLGPSEFGTAGGGIEKHGDFLSNGFL